MFGCYSGLWCGSDFVGSDWWVLVFAFAVGWFLVSGGCGVRAALGCWRCVVVQWWFGMLFLFVFGVTLRWVRG